MIKIIEKYIKDNIKELTIFTLVLLLGIIFGITCLNNTNEDQKESIIIYVSQFKDGLKESYKIDYTRLLGESIKKNIILVLTISFFSLSVIGLPIIYGIVGLKGFCLGYSISSLIMAMGIGKGVLSSLTLLLLTQIISIPCVLILGIEGSRICKNMIYYKINAEIKSEILKCTILFLIILGILFISSLLETYLCSNLFLSIINYL